MEVFMDVEEPMGRKRRRKAKRPAGQAAQPPDAAAQQTAAMLQQREAQWLARLVETPRLFREIEREIHLATQRQADRYVAGLLQKASQQPSVATQVQQVVAATSDTLRPAEKKGD